MSIVIDVYEYGRGLKCEFMFRHTYAGIREMKMKVEFFFGIFVGLYVH